eukprot:1067538-Alexandrium_andersonii.AAC.1
MPIGTHATTSQGVKKQAHRPLDSIALPPVPPDLVLLQLGTRTTPTLGVVSTHTVAHIGEALGDVPGPSNIEDPVHNHMDVRVNVVPSGRPKGEGGAPARRRSFVHEPNEPGGKP